MCAVTGAGSGIGRALAVELARRGARLAISDVDPDGLAATAAAIGGEVHETVVDVADRDAVEAWAAAVAEHHGVVHQIYNNAGIAFSRPVLESEYEDYEQVLGVNLWGVIHGTKAFLPHVIASGDGHVTSISSVNGFFAQSRMSHYCASKFAVRGFSESLRSEMLQRAAPRGGDGRASRRREDQHRRRGAGRSPQARVRADRGGSAAPPDVQREDPAHAARAGGAHHRRRRRGRPTARSSSATTPG